MKIDEDIFMLNSGMPVDTVYRTILNGVIDLGFGIVFLFNNLDISGIIQAEHLGAGFHTDTADDTFTELNNG